MKSFARFLGPILVLTLGLWACEDQVITPEVDVEAAFAKPPKVPKPPPGSPVYLEFLQPSHEEITYDFTSDVLIGQGQISDGWVSANFADAVLRLHFDEEAAYPCWDHDDDPLTPDRCWCEYRSCLRGKCSSFTQGIGVALSELMGIGTVQGDLEVDGADIKFNTIDYEVGRFDMRAWGPGGVGHLYEPWPDDDGGWYTKVEGTTLFVVLWPANKKDPYHSTTCYARPQEMVDVVDYQYRAWK